MSTTAPDLLPGSATGPLRDPIFPQAFFASRTTKATYLQARADDENDLARQWGKLVSSLTVVLTLLAVALFLFGTALALLGRNRMIFAGLAVALVISGGVWTTIRSVGAPPAYSDVAAHAYASGMAALASASTPAQYQAAIDAFKRAISARPDDGMAFEGLAAAYTGHGTEAIGFSVTSLVREPDASLAMRAEQSAYDLGIRNVNLIANLSFDLYAQWLSQTSGPIPPQALDLAQQALALDPSDPIKVFNVAILQLASGSPNAEVSYEKALQMVLNNPSQQLRIVAGAMTDLDNLQTSVAARGRAALRSEIDTEKGIIAASMSSYHVAHPLSDPQISHTSLSPADVTYTVQPNLAQAIFTPPGGWDPQQPGGRHMDQEPTFVIWYERPADARGASGWTGIANLTGWNNIIYSARYDNYYVSSSSAGIGQCLPRAQYRVDVYLGGHRILTDTSFTPPSKDYASLAATDVYLDLCAPISWSPLPVPSVSQAGTTTPLAGVVTAFGSGQGSTAEGAILARLPRSVTDQGSSVDSVYAQRTLRRFLASLTNGAVSGSPLASNLMQTNIDLSGIQSGIATNFSSSSQIFLESGLQQWVLAAVGIDRNKGVITHGAPNNGDVVVSIVYGPPTSFVDQLAARSPNDLIQVFISTSRLCNIICS